MKIGAIVQARMSSERLPGKILHRILNKPMLQYLLDGLKHCSVLDGLVVATSIEPTDEPIRAFCEAYDIYCFSGALEDVAGRFIGVIDSQEFDAFVRISGDSPLLDYRLVSKAVELFKSGGEYDIVTNTQRRSFPKGQSVEVIKSEKFKAIYPLMKTASEKEHVTTYFYSHQEQFSICNFESGMEYGQIQLSVDTHEDMIKIERLVSSMSKPHWEYSFEDLVKLLQ
jgi:spore coat polysaccharide biosynthesis protein SpsF